MALSSPIRRWSLLAACFLGFFTALGLLSSLGAYNGAGHDHPVQWGPLLRQELKSWYSCGLISFLVFWFSGHNRFEPGQVRRWVLTHFAAACVASALYVTLTSWLVSGESSVMHPGQILTFTYLIKKMALEYFVLNLIMYWLVVFAHFSWDFYQRVRDRETQAVQLQRELVEARLESLRMQLNPHFLFNTLHAISALIHENPDAADRMVARLSSLLRQSLDQTKPQEVSLSEELAFLEGYLEIEQTRFAERLKVTKAIDDDAQTALVPFLILQPLVENAIRHGIEPRDEPGSLSITARRDNGKLELCVSDDGPGLTQSLGHSSGQGIGLSNTRSRLEHLYGSEFSLDLADLPQGGLQARISIPFHTNAKAAT